MQKGDIFQFFTFCIRMHFLDHGMNVEFYGKYITVDFDPYLAYQIAVHGKGIFVFSAKGVKSFIFNNRFNNLLEKWIQRFKLKQYAEPTLDVMIF